MLPCFWGKPIFGGGCATAAELTEELHREGQSIGLTTVYRQLEKLSRQGLVHKLVTDEGACYQYCSHADKNEIGRAHV